jgi:hypothetical protein
MVADTGMGMNGRGRRAERRACGLLLAGQGWRVVGTGMGMGKPDDGFESGLSDPHGDFGHGNHGISTHLCRSHLIPARFYRSNAPAAAGYSFAAQKVS